MSLKKATKVLPKILEMLDIKNADNEKIAEMMIGIYESLVEKYRPLINVAPVMIDKAMKDLVPIINALCAIEANVREDKNFQKTMDRCDKLKAKQRFDQLKLYQKAGFRRTEAMSLLLQDIVNLKAIVQDFSYQYSRKSK